MFWHFCHGLRYCTRPVAGQFPVPSGSVAYSVAIKCARLYVLVVLQCSVLVFFFPPSSPLTIISTITIVLISPLNPLFSVTSAWAGARCGARGSWLGCG